MQPDPRAAQPLIPAPRVVGNKEGYIPMMPPENPPCLTLDTPQQTTQ